MLNILQIVIVAVAAILTAFTAYKWNELDWFGRIALIFIILAAILVAINDYRKHTKERLLERVEVKIGDMQSLKGSHIPLIRFGNNGAAIMFPHGIPFSIDDEIPLRVYINNNRLNVYAIIRSPKGEPVAVINDNTWTLFSDEYEYNNDKSGFELVTKGERKVYFQIQIKHNMEVVVIGNLLHKDGFGLKIDENVENEQGGTIMRKVMEFSPEFDYQLKAKPIFKYPRGKYLGVRN